MGNPTSRDASQMIEIVGLNDNFTEAGGKIFQTGQQKF